MGFFDDLVKTVTSGDLEKTLLSGLDKAEGVVKTALDTAEKGLDNADKLAEKADAAATHVVDKMHTAVEKLPGTSEKV